MHLTTPVQLFIMTVSILPERYIYTGGVSIISQMFIHISQTADYTGDINKLITSRRGDNSLFLTTSYHILQSYKIHCSKVAHRCVSARIIAVVIGFATILKLLNSNLCDKDGPVL